MQYLFGEPIVRQPLLFEAPILGTVLLSFVAGWRVLLVYYDCCLWAGPLFQLIPAAILAADSE